MEQPYKQTIISMNNSPHKELVLTKITEQDLASGIEDEYGVLYSEDGKRLLICKNRKLETYSIKLGTKVICNNAFHSCSLLKQVIIPDSVISVGNCAFAFCHSIHSINLPNSVINIGDCALVVNHCKKSPFQMLLPA